ncbi:hypothetical protein KKF34_13910 [Myxococcota bacterium]|nr:hypothetical protein [Myxococcota bacterium]MBU1383095.1 hypothetical protein [Myxococcota bacterium]MBU1497967.1 hypothetical protein [Myxococcota bacterium]
MKIQFLGSIFKPEQKLIDKVESNPPPTVPQLLSELGYPGEQHRFISVIVGGRRLRFNESIASVEEIIITVPVGGG